MNAFGVCGSQRESVIAGSLYCIIGFEYKKVTDGKAFHLVSWHKPVMKAQSPIPITVGIKTEMIVHFREPVSFFIVRIVVRQGQWKRHRIRVQRIVTKFQSWADRKVKKPDEFGRSISLVEYK